MKRVVLLILMFVILSACSKKITLLQDLEQSDVNEIMVLLNRSGIQTERIAVEKQQEVSWTLMVNSGDENRARELLVANHLPREKELGLKGICKEAGLIPTPKTEKCRELLALKGEIINSLISIPGVVDADVVLNIPDKEEFPDENTPPQRPTASAVVEATSLGEGDARLTESKIQRFVANAITGMDERDVSVIISLAQGYEVPIVPAVVAADPTTPPQEEELAPVPEGMVSVGGLKLESRSAKKLKVLLGLFLSVFALLSAALIFILMRQARMRQTTTAMTPKGLAPVAATPALPEKVDVDDVVQQATDAAGRRARGV